MSPEIPVADFAPPRALRARASAAYAQQSRETLEERWVLDHLPLVRHVVQKIAGISMGDADVEDLISAGTLGLVKAAKSFDSTRDLEFKTYAYIRIRGAVLDELRSRSPLSGSVRMKMRHVRKAYEALVGEQGGPPSDEDLADRLGIPLEQLYRTLQEARKRHVLSIHGGEDDEPGLEAFTPPSGEPGPSSQAERRELTLRLAEAIQSLSERDRTMMLLYYERDLTMKEIAEVLEITESRVSQVHASALLKLSMKLKELS